MVRLQRVIASRVVWCLAVVVTSGVVPGVASAQSVRGFAQAAVDDYVFLPITVSVNAWLDDDGVAHGQVSWFGDTYYVPGVGHYPGGPANPWILQVTDIIFDGNSATVSGIAAPAAFPDAPGFTVWFEFTDNGPGGKYDEVDGNPLLAGNVTIDD